MKRLDYYEILKKQHEVFRATPQWQVFRKYILAVLPRLVKSPYKIYFQNIPLFMRVRKRFDAKKIRKIGWNLDFWAIFSEPWCYRSGYGFPGIPCQ